MNAYEKNMAVVVRAGKSGIDLTTTQARTLRLVALELHKWAEPETDLNLRPYADQEAKVLWRAAKLCGKLGLHYYHQRAPHGCALYISKGRLTAANYDKGVPCCE